MIKRSRPCFALAIGLLLGGCSDAPPPRPDPRPDPPGLLHIALSGSADLNPDGNNRPSPVVITLYQLANSGSFVASDYFELANGKSLARDLVAHDQLTLNPGERKTVSEPVDIAARYFAVVAGFHDIDDATWRAVIPVPVHGTTEIMLDLTGLMVKIEAASRTRGETGQPDQSERS